MTHWSYPIGEPSRRCEYSATAVFRTQADGPVGELVDGLDARVPFKLAAMVGEGSRNASSGLHRISTLLLMTVMSVSLADAQLH